MQEPTLGSLEEASQSNSDLRIVLRELIRAHGADALKRGDVAAIAAPDHDIGRAADGEQPGALDDAAR